MTYGSRLLAGQSVGLILLPLMLFHQIQLMVCATLAKRYAHSGQKAEVDGISPPPDMALALINHATTRELIVAPGVQ